MTTIAGRQPPPPAHLSEHARQLWTRTVADYQLEPQAVELLRLACEALDRCEQAREIILAEGPIVRDRFGAPRAHPAIAIERDARLAAIRALRELDLEAEPEPARRGRR